VHCHHWCVAKLLKQPSDSIAVIAVRVGQGNAGERASRLHLTCNSFNVVGEIWAGVNDPHVADPNNPSIGALKRQRPGIVSPDSDDVV
jgi:hypothetical protein